MVPIIMPTIFDFPFLFQMKWDTTNIVISAAIALATILGLRFVHRGK